MQHYSASSVILAAVFAILACYMAYLLMKGLSSGKMSFSWNDVIDLFTGGFLRDRDGATRVVADSEYSLEKDPSMYWVSIVVCCLWIVAALFGIAHVLATKTH